MAITSAFQADDTGSIPSDRSRFIIRLAFTGLFISAPYQAQKKAHTTGWAECLHDYCIQVYDSPSSLQVMCHPNDAFILNIAAPVGKRLITRYLIGFSF